MWRANTRGCGKNSSCHIGRRLENLILGVSSSARPSPHRGPIPNIRVDKARNRWWLAIHLSANTLSHWGFHVSGKRNSFPYKVLRFASATWIKHWVSSSLTCENWWEYRGGWKDSGFYVGLWVSSIRILRPSRRCGHMWAGAAFSNRHY